MKIEVGNYATVHSDEELLIAIAFFTAGGFEFEKKEVFLGETWDFFGVSWGIEGCVAAKKVGTCYCTYVEDLKSKNKNAVEIFFPSAKSILESLD